MLICIESGAYSKIQSLLQWFEEDVNKILDISNCNNYTFCQNLVFCTLNKCTGIKCLTVFQQHTTKSSAKELTEAKLGNLVKKKVK